MNEGKRDAKFARTRRLVGRARQGKSEAINELFSLYFVHIYYVGYRILGDKEQATEAAYETFEKAFKNISALSSPEAFPAWLRSISHNVCIDMLRSKEQPTHHGESVDFTDAATDAVLEKNTTFLPEQNLCFGEAQSEVSRLVDELPTAQREAILLFYFDGLSGEEIATITGTTATVVYRRLADARNNLKSRLPEKEYSALKMDLKTSALAGGPVLSALFAKEAKAIVTPELTNAVRARIFDSLGKPMPKLKMTKSHKSLLTASLAGGLALSAVAAMGVYGYTNKPPAPVAVAPASTDLINEVTQHPSPPDPSQETTAPAVGQGETETQEEPQANPQPPVKQAPEQPRAPTVKATPSPQPEPKVPTILVGETVLAYPAGTVIPLEKILVDAGVVALDARGMRIEVRSTDYRGIDFFTPGIYCLSLNAKDSQNQSAKTAVLTIEIQ